MQFQTITYLSVSILMATFKRGQLKLFRERIYRASISGFQNKYGAYFEFDVSVIHLANSIPQFVGPCVHNLDINVLRERQNEFIFFNLRITEQYQSCTSGSQIFLVHFKFLTVQRGYESVVLSDRISEQKGSFFISKFHTILDNYLLVCLNIDGDF